MAATRNLSLLAQSSQPWAGIYGSHGSPRPISSWLRRQSIAKTSYICMCTPLSMSQLIATPLITDIESLLKYLRQPQVLPHEIDDSTKRRELLERTRRELQTTLEPLQAMKMIDTLQRLGLAYHFEDDINSLLTGFSNGQPDEDLLTASLRFRLLRHNGHRINPNIFQKFMDKQGKFIDSLKEDTRGLFSLYEASYLGANGEDILLQALEFTKAHLKESLPSLAPPLAKKVSQALELPRHRRMARLEARRYIEEYGGENGHSPDLLELAKLDYNKVQSLHQLELSEISRWWKQLGLVDKLTFARDRPLECFLWTVGILPEPKYSSCRIELAKTIAILLVIDDIFDTHGTLDELILFTNAIRRWDLEAMEDLPEYMRICYMALYNTTNEICYKILKQNGWSVLPYLKATWIDMIEGFMLEASWLNTGYVPNMEEYVENGVTTAGAYMALVHLFFLIGQGVTEENVKLLVKPYPKLFSYSGRILRLWDDLGTAKEEQERGDLASSIDLFMRENNITSDEEGRKCILKIIDNLWKELNGELVSRHALPLAIIKAAFNMARASQVVYQHEEDSYFSSVDNYVQALFFTPFN
uniref:Monoterpene synthase TPS4, chloroplastic n=1 Tax=Cananga odorata TaxID=13393 RepID=TPS4_CANOD|nr:RecName: Full=Monoterpene synthase TPS4, chloroplastic; AltName: Full=Geraniol synthase TPS4; AltName: Full=Terpene synthase 4; Short=CoTPS4; Flags: Precursor [Cananga odorata]QMW48845.1 terpene synthase 4 [Cananga odorata]